MTPGEQGSAAGRPGAGPEGQADSGAEEVPDVAALVAEIQAEVERRRRDGEYPAALLERLRAEFHPSGEPEPPETAMLIESARPLRSETPVAGPAIVFAKRVVRRLLAWYVAPIARDQTRFNQAIVRELRSLELRVEALEGRAGRPAPRERGGSRRPGGG